jgi:hypothetical protein
MLGVHSLNNSPSQSTDMTANTGAVSLASGHNRDLSNYAINSTAEIRHQILDTLGGAGVFHAKYTGKYHDPLASSWTPLSGHSTFNILSYHFAP